MGSQDKPGNGGIIITDKNYGDFEVIVEMKNDYGPDSGLFLRSTERGQAYQALIDYHGGGSLMGIYGEGLSGGIRAAGSRRWRLHQAICTLSQDSRERNRVKEMK